MAKEDLTLGEKIVESGLKLYDRFSDRKTMPANRRIFLESVLDKTKNPITESSFNKAELDALLEVIFNKYKAIEPAIDQYEKYLLSRIKIHNKAVAAKDKDRIMYPDFAKRYLEDFEAIKAYKQGKLTPVFLELASGLEDYPRHHALKAAELRSNSFNVKPIIGYEDYGIDVHKARQALAGQDPRAALHTTLGRFRYEIDPATNNLTIVDRYDFNPLTTPRVTAEQVLTSPEPLQGGVYGLLRQYAGRVLPDGSGRNVRVQLNNLAPAKKNNLID
jgi:hypothetical protein